MKRYLVRIEFRESHDMVEIVKAKDRKDLERKIAESYEKALTYYNDLLGIEYEELRNLPKLTSYKGRLLVGAWTGAECLKDYIKENDKGVIK